MGWMDAEQEARPAMDVSASVPSTLVRPQMVS